MVWIKLTEQFREGLGEVTYLQYLGQPEQMDEWLTDRCWTLVDINHFEENEGWRGYLTEVVDKPSQEWIDKKIIDIQLKIEVKKETLRVLKDLKDQFPFKQDNKHVARKDA